MVMRSAPNSASQPMTVSGSRTATEPTTTREATPLMLAALRRFLGAMSIAVPLVVLTGLALFLPVGFGNAPVGWHVMLTLGLVMAGVYAFIHLVLLPRLRTHCAASAWPLAAQALNAIRRLVALNLALGVLAIAAAISAR